MNTTRTIALYGSASSREQAKLLLENLPQVKRMDVSADMAEVRLILRSPLRENSLIPLLAQSGISGFRLI